MSTQDLMGKAWQGSKSQGKKRERTEPTAVIDALTSESADDDDKDKTFDVTDALTSGDADAEDAQYSINTKGWCVIGVESCDEDLANFENKVWNSTRNWFDHHLSMAVDNFHGTKVRVNSKNDTAQQGQRLFASLSAANRDEIMQAMRDAFDATKLQGRRNIFVTEERSKACAKIAPGGGALSAYLDSRVQYTKQGMQTIGQNNIPGAWLGSGFGIWAKLYPAMGLRLVRDASKRFGDILGTTMVPRTLPHLIVKPPGGSVLKTHHDQMPTVELQEKLRAHVNAGKSTLEWTQEHGLQILAHVSGGHERSGATYAIAPMTCEKLLFLITTILDNRQTLHSLNAWKKGTKEEETFCDKIGGPYFCDWTNENVLAFLNAKLAEQKMTSIGLEEMRPWNVCGYYCAWPIGFPHGSRQNDDARVSITMPLMPVTSRKTDEATKATETRLANRLRNLARVATPPSSATELAEWETAKQSIQKDKKRYEDGPTHQNPDLMYDLMFNSGTSRGPFASLAPTITQADEFIAFAGWHTSGTSGSSGTLARTEGMIPASSVPLPPPSSIIDDEDFRILNVRQPWATALVNGHKNVENRPGKLKMKLPGWVAILASDSKPSGPTMVDLRSRLARDPRASVRRPMPNTKDTFPYQKIVGIVKFAGSWTEAEMPEPWKHSPWYNGSPDYGWCVLEAHAFEPPIDLVIKGCLSLRILQNMAEPLQSEIRMRLRSAIDALRAR